MQCGSTFKKSKKVKKEVCLLVQKVLIHIIWGIIIASYFLYFYILNIVFFRIHLFTNLYVYNIFVHRKKSYQLLICRVAKNLAVLELLNHFIKSNTVAYKKNLVYSLYSSEWFPSKKSFKWKNCKIIRGVFRTLWKSSRCLTGFLNKPLVVAASDYKRLHLSNKMCLIWEYITKVFSF